MSYVWDHVSKDIKSLEDAERQLRKSKQHIPGEKKYMLCIVTGAIVEVKNGTIKGRESASSKQP